MLEKISYIRYPPSLNSFVTYFSRELKEHFAEYTEQVVKLMVPMLKFYFHDGVREPDVSIYMRNSFILPMK